MAAAILSRGKWVKRIGDLREWRSGAIVSGLIEIPVHITTCNQSWQVDLISCSVVSSLMYHWTVTKYGRNWMSVIYLSQSISHFNIADINLSTLDPVKHSNMPATSISPPTAWPVYYNGDWLLSVNLAVLSPQEVFRPNGAVNRASNVPRWYMVPGFSLIPRANYDLKCLPMNDSYRDCRHIHAHTPCVDVHALMHFIWNRQETTN